MVTQAKPRASRAKKQKPVEAPAMPEFIKPLADLPLSSRKEIWQRMDDLEGRGDAEDQAVAQAIRGALETIGR